MGVSDIVNLTLQIQYGLESRIFQVKNSHPMGGPLGRTSARGLSATEVIF
jgi:hypothetical protein